MNGRMDGLMGGWILMDASVERFGWPSQIARSTGMRTKMCAERRPDVIYHISQSISHWTSEMGR